MWALKIVVFVENIGFFIDLEETIEHFNDFEETIENFKHFWWNHNHWKFVGALTISLNGFQWSETIGKPMEWFQ